MINPKQRIRKILLIDLMACFVFTGIAGCFSGIIGFKSAGLAGVSYFIPNAYRTYRLFRYQGAQAARLILKGFYQGEMLKFGLSIVFFAIVFSKCTINPPIFFGTYIGMQMLVWLTPVFNKH